MIRYRDASNALHAAEALHKPDFHALRSWQAETLDREARALGYRKRKNAPGSRARMFYQHCLRVLARGF